MPLPSDPNLIFTRTRKLEPGHHQQLSEALKLAAENIESGRGARIEMGSWVLTVEEKHIKLQVAY